MTRLLPLVLGIALTVAAGAVKVVWSAPRDIKEIVARLERTPLTVGDWVGKAQPYDAEMYRAAGIQGAVLRTFRRPSTGDQVSLLIVCGRPGPISVHTPDVCYGASGYGMLTERIPRVVPVGQGRKTADFWTLFMTKQKSAVEEDLEVTFGWSTDGTWQAPERDARLVFAGSPALFKLYVVRVAGPGEAKRLQASAASGEAAPTPATEFLRALLPDLNRALFKDAPAPATATREAKAEADAG